MADLKLDHIGIAVQSLAEGAAFYEALGLAVGGTEEVSEQRVKVAFLQIGDTRLELLEPTSADSPIAKHLEKRGPGLHHLCVRVDDIEAVMAHLAGAGFRLLSDEPQVGAHGCRVCFVHPKSTGGVLLELSQPAVP
ncbi:MAG: methylmalonyl-CoA epimerase [Thermoanaerobaculales bacterium]|nr:methylmalonyl-CoA epimerase [Thermoanaerobaculales bacterium]